MRTSSTVLLTCLLLGSCSYAKDLWQEPEPEDLMGESLYLEEAGSNIEMDWGPGQENLLHTFSALKDESIGLKQSLAAMRTKREGLEASLEETHKELNAERSLRAQEQAENESLRKSRRELESKILSLSIAMARLEQENLLLHIARAEKNLDDLRNPRSTEAAAPPRIRR